MTPQKQYKQKDSAYLYLYRAVHIRLTGYVFEVLVVRLLVPPLKNQPSKNDIELQISLGLLEHLQKMQFSV